jgi:hypothetical protein
VARLDLRRIRHRHVVDRAANAEQLFAYFSALNGQCFAGFVALSITCRNDSLQLLRLNTFIAAVWFLALGGASLLADPATAVVVDQPAFESDRFTAANGTLRFETDSKSRTVEVKDLVVWGKLAESRQGKQFLLADGGMLVADIVKSDNDRLIVDSYQFGEVTLPLESLAGILLSPPADHQRHDALEFRIRDAKGDEDRLILDNGDELTGTITALDDTQAELEAKIGKVKIALSRVAAIVFNPTLRAAAPERGLRIVSGMRDGSRLFVRNLSTSDGQAELDTVAGPKLTAKADRVVFLQPLGGNVTYLSDLNPTGYRHVPFLELSWPWKADCNVLGTRLRAGGELYLKGLGMHSASRLSFPLDGSQRRFEALLAIDDQTSGGGSVVFRVYLGTEPAYASPVVHGGDKPLPVSIDLPPKASTLSLIVDYADRGDEQDHANWLNARLVK